nr:PREDICTED: uncharacterized protein LOC107078504 isoform X3 [Lepisosteus oculatus]
MSKREFAGVKQVTRVNIAPPSRPCRRDAAPSRRAVTRRAGSWGAHAHGTAPAPFRAAAPTSGIPAPDPGTLQTQTGGGGAAGLVQPGAGQRAGVQGQEESPLPPPRDRTRPSCRLLKARLRPLCLADVGGPTVGQCQGIVPGHLCGQRRTPAPTVPQG